MAFTSTYRNRVVYDFQVTETQMVTLSTRTDQQRCAAGRDMMDNTKVWDERDAGAQ